MSLSTTSLLSSDKTSLDNLIIRHQRLTLIKYHMHFSLKDIILLNQHHLMDEFIEILKTSGDDDDVSDEYAKEVLSQFEKLDSKYSDEDEDDNTQSSL
ncbi:hypothetical protein I4U23_022156 [Adineta vaga]|nr:hypothetical protein I4U23_022156 [Adineta vaga]